VKERPILFSAPMVRALLVGTKTQTRRIVKPQPERLTDWSCAGVDGLRFPWMTVAETLFDSPELLARCPYGTPGDRLWVRETWSLMNRERTEAWTPRATYVPNNIEVVYRADEDHGHKAWRPSIFMSRCYSRITLEVTGVRVERLQDISEEDARAEGVAVGRIPADEDGPERIGFVFGHDDGRCTLYPTARAAFEVGWRSINGAESWKANPWCWCISFRRIDDAMA